MEFTKQIDCQSALGLESGAISNGQMSASSQHNSVSGANRARLNIQGGVGGWVTAINDENQWFQVDLGNQLTTVTGVATQGRYDIGHWIISYNLQYSDDEINFHYYKEQGQFENKVKIRFFGPILV